MNNLMIFHIYFSDRWIYTINRAEAKEKSNEANKPGAEKVSDEKPCEMYIQNEGLYVISDMKSV